MEQRTYKLIEYLQELFKIGAIPPSANRIQTVSAFLEDLKMIEANTAPK